MKMSFVIMLLACLSISLVRQINSAATNNQPSDVGAAERGDPGYHGKYYAELGNIAQALKCFRKASGKESGEAEYQLTISYLEGAGVEINEKEGFELRLVFGDALQVERLPMCKLLAEAKYRPINVPVDFFIDPLIKPDPGTGEVTDGLKIAYC